MWSNTTSHLFDIRISTHFVSKYHAFDEHVPNRCMLVNHCEVFNVFSVIIMIIIVTSAGGKNFRHLDIRFLLMMSQDDKKYGV